MVCSWRSKKANPGAQNGLVIDRRDGVVNLCEVEFTNGEDVIDASEEKALRNKVDAFADEVAPHKALHLTLVTVEGVAHNSHYDVVTSEAVASDLFMQGWRDTPWGLPYRHHPR